MDISRYIGHDSQVMGVEEHRLIGGKGDGMRLFEIRNGKGLAFTVSADRCADISRLTYRGVNCGYFAPCGYVAPAYYDGQGSGFLKSFTAGFLTTCGLTAVGAPCEDDGEALPLHGTIANQPSEKIGWDIESGDIVLRATINDARIFGHKLRLRREIRCSTKENAFTVSDTVENYGDAKAPFMMMYHMNIGYPLLSENSVLNIPSQSVEPRDARAAEGLSSWHIMPPPTAGFEEQCYYHQFSGDTKVSISNPDTGIGLQIEYDAGELNHFTQWKMAGVRDYALGLEPGNCHTEGRDKLRAENKLSFLAPGEAQTKQIRVSLFSL